MALVGNKNKYFAHVAQQGIWETPCGWFNGERAALVIW